MRALLNLLLGLFFILLEYSYNLQCLDGNCCSVDVIICSYHWSTVQLKFPIFNLQIFQLHNSKCDKKKTRL